VLDEADKTACGQVDVLALVDACAVEDEEDASAGVEDEDDEGAADVDVGFVLANVCCRELAVEENAGAE